MNDIHEIEARLERSLRNQIGAPRLDGTFNDAVWKQIAAAEAPTTNLEASSWSRSMRVARWLLLSNVLGATVALALAVHFAGPTLAGLETNISVPIPQISASTVGELIEALGFLLGAVMLVLGLGLTSFGQRLRSMIS